MCGIAGLIGKSKNPKLSFKLAANLFEQAETRGTDAAGFWGTKSDDSGIIYHKEPIKSSEMVKKEIWNQVEGLDPDLLLMHARGASIGSGLPSINKNNHPFSSNDRNIGLVHNGRVPDNELDALKKRFEVNSKCDSEIILRIFESGENLVEQNQGEFPDIDKVKASRLLGLKDIWAFTPKSHFACALGERLPQQSRRLWLFRNKHRPLWLIDLRKELGQVFFCSAPEIWSDALIQSNIRSYLHRKIKLIELPTDEIWLLSITAENRIPEDDAIEKYEVKTSGGLILWDYEGDEIKINKRVPEIPIITKLGNDEEAPPKIWTGSSSVLATSKVEKKEPSQCSNAGAAEIDYEGYGCDFNTTKPKESEKEDKKMKLLGLIKICRNITETTEKIKQAANDKSADGKIDAKEYARLVNFLEECHNDLLGNLKLLES